MTTQNWSTVLDQSTDAAFRVWGSELAAKFAAVGMVQTADTGQINWTTVVRAAVINTVAGYEIWKLSSGNLYFKIEYGTGQTQPNAPSLWLTVGTGSNGSGTLTGQLSTRTQLGDVGVPTSTSTNYQSYLCATANYFGLSWKLGSSGTPNQPRTFVAVAQTVDATGTATSVGYSVLFNTSGAPQLRGQCVATTAAITGAVNNSATMCMVPMTVTLPPSSLDGAGNNQAFLAWFNIFGAAPILPLLHVAMVLLTDLAIGTTASMTLVGSTPHTYINSGIGHTMDPLPAISGANAGKLILWE